MKALLAFTIFIVSTHSFANYSTCPEYIFNKPNYTRAWKFLKSLNPRYNYDGCEIELHICDPGAGATDNIIGDMSIKNKKGEYQYVTFIFPEENEGRVSAKIDADTNWISYKIVDKNPDKIDGKYKKTVLNLVTSGPKAAIKRLMLSTYSSKEHDHVLGVIPIPIQSLCEE